MHLSIFQQADESMLYWDYILQRHCINYVKVYRILRASTVDLMVLLRMRGILTSWSMLIYFLPLTATICLAQLCIHVSSSIFNWFICSFHTWSMQFLLKNLWPPLLSHIWVFLPHNFQARSREYPAIVHLFIFVWTWTCVLIHF